MTSRTAEGGFASALDADTDGVEGLTYAWTPRQLAEVLGEDDGRRAAALLKVTGPGTFEHGMSTLQLRTDPDDPQWWADVRDRLLAARDLRPQPARDDKVVTGWNGLAIAALSEAGALLEDSSYVDAARACAQLLLERHLVEGRLRRASREGAVGAAMGVADDYGNLAEGLLTLHQSTGEPRWLTSAGELLDTALAHFADGQGGFFDTADDAEHLFTRPHSPADNAEPSGHAALAGALLTYSALVGSTRHREAADAAVAAAAEPCRSRASFRGLDACRGRGDGGRTTAGGRRRPRAAGSAAATRRARQYLPRPGHCTRIPGHAGDSAPGRPTPGGRRRSGIRLSWLCL